MIYNAPSIYKQGGGGGYKDGGALLDGDYIKVENNSISTYTNTSRTDINYYFEVKDGEPLNAIIELVNEYNATVHIYIVQNGLLIPLGNVGGDTVNAGEDYKINVVGDSFAIEQVTAPVSPDPAAIIIEGSIYGVKKTGNRIWAVEDLKFGLSGTVEKNDLIYYTWNHIPFVEEKLPSGWRVANYNDWADLKYNSGWTTAQLKSINGWIQYNGRGPFPGTNESGLNFLPRGLLNNDESTYHMGWNGYYWCTTGNNSSYYIGCDNIGSKQDWTNTNKTAYVAIRICCDA